MDAIPSSDIPKGILQEDVDEYCARIFVSPVEPIPREQIMQILTAHLTKNNVWPTEISFNMHPHPMRDTPFLRNHKAAYVHLQFLTVQQAKDARELLRWNSDLEAIAPPGECIDAKPCREMHEHKLPGRWGTPPPERNRLRVPRALGI